MDAVLENVLGSTLNKSSKHFSCLINSLSVATTGRARSMKIRGNHLAAGVVNELQEQAISSDKKQPISDLPSFGVLGRCNQEKAGCVVIADILAFFPAQHNLILPPCCFYHGPSRLSPGLRSLNQKTPR